MLYDDVSCSMRRQWVPAADAIGIASDTNRQVRPCVVAAIPVLAKPTEVTVSWAQVSVLYDDASCSSDGGGGGGGSGDSTGGILAGTWFSAVLRQRCWSIGSGGRSIGSGTQATILRMVACEPLRSNGGNSSSTGRSSSGGPSSGPTTEAAVKVARCGRMHRVNLGHEAAVLRALQQSGQHSSIVEMHGCVIPHRSRDG